MTSIRHLKVSAGKALPQVGYSRLRTLNPMSGKLDIGG
jgi:hypothetical protein